MARRKQPSESGARAFQGQGRCGGKAPDPGKDLTRLGTLKKGGREGKKRRKTEQKTASSKAPTVSSGHAT